MFRIISLVSEKSDIVFDLDDHRFVIETKIEKETATLSSRALAQAFRYANKLGTSDVIVLIYSEKLFTLLRKMLKKKRRYRKVLREHFYIA